ncbi:hypothetical protein PI125_g26999 [Phytophthora idaei]|nr:hypothetical protein PI125_g26999 [Phytophthora idaei]
MRVSSYLSPFVDFSKPSFVDPYILKNYACPDRRMASSSRRTPKASTAEQEATLAAGLAVVLHEQPRVAALQHALDDLVDVSWHWNIARACALESHDSSSDDGGAR